MAQGAAALFDALPGYLRANSVSIPAVAGGNWKVALCSDPITALLVSELSPALNISTNINEVSGSGYTAKGIALTLLNTDTGGKVTFKLDTGTHTGGKITWSKTAGGPTNIKSAVVFDEDSTTDLAVCFVDMTADSGTTPASMVAADVSITFTDGGVAGAVFTVERT